MMVEEEDDLRLVLSSSEEDKDDSDSDDGMIQIKNIEDGDSSVEIVETVTVDSTQCEATGKVSEHEFVDDQDGTSLTTKQVKTLSQDVAGQMEDGRWFLVKKCKVLIRNMPITLVRTLQEAECEEERKGGKSLRPGGEKQVRGEEGQVTKRSERCKPGLGKQVLMTRTIEAGVSRVQQTGKKSRQSSPGEKQTGTVLRTEGLTDRLSGLVTTLTDRVGMGKEKVRVNRLTRGKKRKLLDDDGMEASDFEVNSYKVLQFDYEETGGEASQDRLELAVAENFINVCRDVEECDEMKTKSDDACPIDMEDKAAIDPLYLLVKPCYIILQKIDIECKGTREEATSIKVKEVDITRGIGLDSINSQEENHPVSMDEIALELQKMESSTRGNERSGIALDIPATGVVNSDDEEALRRIFENCPVAAPVNKSGSNAVSIVKVIEVETGGDIVPFGNNNVSESGEACNGGKNVQVDDEAAIPASRIQEVVTESPDNGRLDGEVVESISDVVEVVNELNENMLQGAKEKVVPSSNHPDVLSIRETVNMKASPDDPHTADELNNNEKDGGRTMAPSEVGSGGEEVEVIDEASSGDIGGMTENLGIVENMKVMNGEPLEKVEEIPDDCSPDQDDKLIINAPPSSPHDSEPPSPPSSVDIVTDESFEDWESVCDTSASEEVNNNNNTGVLSVDHSEDFDEYQEKLYGNIWRPHDEEVSEKFVEEFSKKPVGADEDDLADKNGNPVPLSSSGDEVVSGSTDGVLISDYPHSSSPSYLETFPSRDSSVSLVRFSSQGSFLDEASSQGSSVVKLSSQGSVLVETASEGLSVETLSQASSVVETSSQASSVVETSPQAFSVVETSSQASSVVETSSQGSFTLHSDSSSEVSLIEETRSQCSPYVEDGVKGASSVSGADTDSQPGAEAVRQEEAAVLFDDLNLTSNDDEDADDDFLSLTNDVTFDDLSQVKNEIVKSAGQSMEKKTPCQEIRSPNVSVMLSKPLVSTRTGDPSSMPVDVSSRLDASSKSVESSMAVDVSIGAVDATNIGQESEEASNIGSVVEASGIEESSCYQSMKTREINKVTKPKKNSRKQSIFDISIDESAVSEAKYKKSSAIITPAVSSHSSPKLSSLVKGFAKEIISNVSSLPCSSKSSTAKSSKEARASCPQSPSITSSTGPTSAPLHSSVNHFEESDSDSSSDDDVIILEESGVSSSNMTHVKGSLTPPEKSIKPDRKVPEPRPSITNVNVDMWKGFGPRDKPKQSKKEGNNKKTKAKEPVKEINVDKSKTKISDSQHSKFKTSESRKPKVKVNSKHSQSDSSKSAPKADSPPHTNSKVSALPSLQFKIPKGPSKVPGNSSHSKEMIQCDGKLVRIRNFLKEEDIIPNFDQFLKDDNWQKVESMYDKVTNIKKSASDKKINDVADDAEILDLKSQNLELEKLKTDEERKKFSQSQFKNSVSTDPANNLTFHGFRSLKNKNRTKNLPTESFSIAGGQLLPQPGFKRRNWTEDSKEREAHEKVDKKINLNDFGSCMKKLFVHKFNKKLGSTKGRQAELDENKKLGYTKSKGRQAELDEFQTYLGHYKTGQEETSNFLTYYNSQKELNLDQVKEVVDLENQYSTFTNYYGEAGDFFCKDCNKRHKFCQ